MNYLRLIFCLFAIDPWVRVANGSEPLAHQRCRNALLLSYHLAPKAPGYSEARLIVTRFKNHGINVQHCKTEKLQTPFKAGAIEEYTLVGGPYRAGIIRLLQNCLDTRSSTPELHFHLPVFALYESLSSGQMRSLLRETTSEDLIEPRVRRELLSFRGPLMELAQSRLPTHFEFYLDDRYLRERGLRHHPKQRVRIFFWSKLNTFFDKYFEGL